MKKIIIAATLMMTSLSSFADQTQIDCVKSVLRNLGVF